MTTVHPPPVGSRSRSSAPPPIPRAAPRVRILVVDDEPVIGSVLRRIFSRTYDVTVVEHGKMALSMIDAGAEFDVVLCDVVMPDVSGPQVYEAVRARHPRLIDRFVFITGGALHEKSRRFLASIANPVLYKPFDLGVVRDLVRRVAGLSL